MKYLALLLLTGCATQSFDDLLLERAVCANSSENCDDLDKEVAKREKMREWRKNAETNCPKGLIPFCDSTMDGCGKKVSRKPVEYVCITPKTLDEMRIW